ncbi:hypothetical protein, partial [Segatella copri]|uniref:hypothetical protein n=1 Tax=Segatella copri TaxID=165179 RepID=UPI001EE469B6
VGEQSASYHAAHHYQRDFLHKFIFYVVYSSSFYSSLQIYDFFCKKSQAPKKNCKVTPSLTVSTVQRVKRLIKVQSQQ